MKKKKAMIIREAKIDDIKQIQVVRNSVTENTLSNPDLVTDQDCEEFITVRGKGWVCEIDKLIVGFAIADLKENNIWALFLDPTFEKKGFGQLLHKTMLDWYFTQTKEKIWLGTAFNTRAEKFYRKASWTEVGTHGTKEIKFSRFRFDKTETILDKIEHITTVKKADILKEPICSFYHMDYLHDSHSLELMRLMPQFEWVAFGDIFELVKGELQSSKVIEDEDGDGVCITMSIDKNDYKKINNCILLTNAQPMDANR